MRRRVAGRDRRTIGLRPGPFAESERFAISVGSIEEKCFAARERQGSGDTARKRESPRSLVAVRRGGLPTGRATSGYETCERRRATEIDADQGHLPVLRREVSRLLAIQPGETLVDVTVGLAGHAVDFAEALGSDGLLIGLDVDPIQLESARQRLSSARCRVELVRSNFGQLGEVLGALKVPHVDVLFADLGVSSTQLRDPSRGFSFQLDGPLDMRLDPELTTTAADLVNRLKERDLADLIFQNSQEPASRRIARRICEVRRDGRITTTRRLAEVVADALGVDPLSHRERIHPATRTFMALRIAVNEELRNLDRLLAGAAEWLQPGGRFGVISFHSLEDKPVKFDFRKRKNENIYRVLTPKPVVADEEERRDNPRSRSAKLRVVERLSAEAA